MAKDFAAALPESSPPEFEKWLPPGVRHPHYRSGNSSQTLALGLLGIAAWCEPSLEWWWEALDVRGPSGLQPSFAFESKLAREVLGETGGATSVDFVARDDSAVICCECKWVEQGVGACTCASVGGRPAAGTCRRGIYDCAAYWKTAAELFGLPRHVYGEGPCRLGFAYQAVRNVAAALALAGPQQTAVFALLYDAENPYFRGSGDWPGWLTVLDHTLDGAHPQLQFRRAFLAGARRTIAARRRGAGVGIGEARPRLKPADWRLALNRSRSSGVRCRSGTPCCGGPEQSG